MAQHLNQLTDIILIKKSKKKQKEKSKKMKIPLAKEGRMVYNNYRGV